MKALTDPSSDSKHAAGRNDIQCRVRWCGTRRYQGAKFLLSGLLTILNNQMFAVRTAAVSDMTHASVTPTIARQACS